MRFLITMHMPTRQNKVVDEHGESQSSGHLVHQMHVEHPAKDLVEFAREMESPFIVVEEFYRNPTTGGYYSRGNVIINTFHVGKVKEYDTGN